MDHASLDPSSPPLPPDLAALVRRELHDGERVVKLWRPDPVRPALVALLIWIFAIPWTAFSLFWTAAASGGYFGLLSYLGLAPPVEAPPSLLIGVIAVVAFLFGLPFVVIGFCMLAMPYAAYRKAQRT